MAGMRLGGRPSDIAEDSWNCSLSVRKLEGEVNTDSSRGNERTERHEPNPKAGFAVHFERSDYIWRTQSSALSRSFSSHFFVVFLEFTCSKS